MCVLGKRKVSTVQGSGFQGVVSRPAASASLGPFLEMQNLRFHWRPTESETPGLGPSNLFYNTSADYDAC